MLKSIFWLLLIVLPTSFIGFMLVIYPRKIVRLHGKFYKKMYRDYIHVESDKIDSLPMLPTDRAMMKGRDFFQREAPEHPEKFVGLVRFYRLLGIIVLSFLMVWLCVFALAVVTGSFRG